MVGDHILTLCPTTTMITVNITTPQIKLAITTYALENPSGGVGCLLPSAVGTLLELSPGSTLDAEQLSEKQREKRKNWPFLKNVARF